MNEREIDSSEIDWGNLNYPNYVYLGVSEYVTDAIDTTRLPDRFVFTIHGINDGREWAEKIGSEAISRGHAIQFGYIQYEFLDTVNFLFNKRALKSCAFDAIVAFDRIFLDENYSGVPKYIIAHSYGTYVLCKVLKHRMYRFDKIFLVGSICKNTVSPLLASRTNCIINDVGTRDYIVVIAAALFPRKYAATGAIGFDVKSVNNRYFKYNHSQAVGLEHYKNYIRPEILDENYEYEGCAPFFTKSYPVIIILLFKLILIGLVLTAMYEIYM